MELINAALDNRWSLLTAGQALNTPKNKPFSISTVNPQTVEISTSKSTLIAIDRNAFVAALQYLINNNHTTSAASCRIQANYTNPGQLNLAARNPNNSKKVIIHYLIPLLSHMNLVDVNASGLHSTWLK
jgi:hypothetical protein